MRIGCTPLNIAAVLLCLLVFMSHEALAQPASVRFQISSSALVDCRSPMQLQNFPVTVAGTGVLNSDQSASADVNVTEFIFVNQIHFEGRLGGRPTPAPGGSAQVRVSGKDRLHLTWSLPNNDLTIDIIVRGSTCSARIGFALKRGMREYSLYDGHGFHYCSRPRVEQTSCQVN